MATKQQRINFYNKLTNLLYEIDHSKTANEEWPAIKSEFVKIGYKLLHKVAETI
jgi:hypothetical protein